MSAISRRKAGKGLAICPVNEGVLVGVGKGNLEALQYLWKKSDKKKTLLTGIGKPHPRAFCK